MKNFWNTIVRPHWVFWCLVVPYEALMICLYRSMS